MKWDQLPEHALGFGIFSLVPKILREMAAADTSLNMVRSETFLVHAQRLTDLGFCFCVPSLLIENVAKRFGRIDVCVANAGGPPAKNFLSISADEWRKAVDLNLMSTVHLARAVIPYMQRHRWGRIITITSVSVKQPVQDLVLSNSVRAAVVGLVKSLSNEFGKDGILVNNVAPGFTATERLQELAQVRALAAGSSPQQVCDGWAAETPVKRLGNPQEIADVIVWLASERASYITGQTVLADGGIYHGL